VRYTRLTFRLFLPWPEVNPASELSDKKNVNPFHNLTPQWRGFEQLVKEDYWAEIGEEVELGADLQEALFRANLLHVPLRTTDSTEDDAIADTACFKGVVWQRVAVLVNGNPTDVVLRDGEPGVGPAPFQLAQDLDRFSCHPAWCRVRGQG
jgi:hypothetical protein